jgi:glyoxylase-like metal-dependent hydrolase (beta-lactamase superfamily II)
VYSLRVWKVGEAMAPGPISFYMSHWDELEYNPHFIWLARDGRRTVLVNTGLPPDLGDLSVLNQSCRAAHPENYFAPDHIWAPRQLLAEAGVKPEDVDTVLITAMGAYATGNIELFPNAEVYLSRTGWLDFMAPARPSGQPRQVVFTDATLTHLLTRAWPRVHLVGADEEVLPGIRMFWVGCHHRGSMAVSIATARGRVVISDSIFMYENVDQGIPIGVLENIFECQDALERIRRDADIVIPAHDQEVLVRYPDGIIA